MTPKKGLKTSDSTEYRYQNSMAQLFSIMMPWSLYWVSGRASAKTVQVLAERAQQAVEECPGAPFAWVSDTYSNLHQNVIPSLLEGLRMLGWNDGDDYVIDRKPPIEWQQRMYNVVKSFKHVMTFPNGFTFTFISLDRPSIGAGRSFVGIFGDEVKYWPEEKLTNILKAVRGFRAKYGDNPWYRSRTFTTDMYNPNHIGEYPWILKLTKQMDKKRIMLLAKVGFVMNDVRREYASVLQQFDEVEDDYKKGKASANALNTAKRKLELAEASLTRWERRWVKARSGVTLFLINSSYVNVDILGEEFFRDEMGEGLEGFETNILSMIPKMSPQEKFYPNLTDKHFYSDGFLNDVIESHEFGWTEDCTCLRYLDKNKALDAGMDAGNMLSMVFGQRRANTCRIVKEIYTLPPDNERQLADRFLAYFKPHRMKVLNLYYDRAMNNYHKVKADMATKIKQCIERDAEGKRTGWRVILKSRGQGDIFSNTEYRFMDALLSEQLQNSLFTLLIDRYNCPNLKAEMENCPIKIAKDKFNRDIIRKGKKGDKLSFERLPKESTNLTDALKYFLMRRPWFNIWDSFTNRDPSANRDPFTQP